MLRFITFCFLCLVCNIFSGTYEERFEHIYEEKLWGANEAGEGFFWGRIQTRKY